MEMRWTKVWSRPSGSKSAETRRAKGRFLCNMLRFICVPSRIFILIGSLIWREMRSIEDLAELVKMMAIFILLQVKSPPSPKNLSVFTKTVRANCTLLETSNTKLNQPPSKSMASNQLSLPKSAKTTLDLPSLVTPQGPPLDLRIVWLKKSKILLVKCTKWEFKRYKRRKNCRMLQGFQILPEKSQVKRASLCKVLWVGTTRRASGKICMRVARKRH